MFWQKKRFLGERITALPIVDEDNRLINIYSKFDVFNLESFADLEVKFIPKMKSFKYNVMLISYFFTIHFLLQVSVESATKFRMYFDRVYTCQGKTIASSFSCEETHSTVNPNI